MDVVINQIHTLSTKNDSDLKKLKDFLRHEQETLKANAHQIDQALQMLDPAVNTLGVAFLLAAQLSAGGGSRPASTSPSAGASGASSAPAAPAAVGDQRQTFAYVGAFLRVADEQQVKKGFVPVNTVCKCYAQMAIDEGRQAMLRSLGPLQCALEKLRPNAETLTPVHAEFLRVCLRSKAYHLGARVLQQPIFDISLSSNNCTQMTPQSFLCYFYYGAMIHIGMKEYSAAMRLLLVVLTCPASCLSTIQADAYKKFVLVSLKVHGELQALPVYASHIVQRYAKIPSYALDIAEAFKQGDSAALQRVIEEKAQAIEADNNMGLAKQVVASLQRHKLQTLTKTYLTLSLGEIAREIGFEEGETAKVADLLFNMISEGEINARIDQSTGNVSFEDESDDMDVGMVNKMQGKLQSILGLAQRIATFEQEVVSSEAYIRKTAALEGGATGAVPALGGYDFMDM